MSEATHGQNQQFRGSARENDARHTAGTIASSTAQSLGRTPARTVLTLRIRQRRLSFAEFLENLEIFARQNGEVGTLSMRHLQRLTSGNVSADQLRPATIRLLEHFFGSSIEDLLATSEQPAGNEPPERAQRTRRHVLNPPEESAQFDRRTVIKMSVAAGTECTLGTATPRSVDPAVIDHLITLRSALVSSDSLLGPSHVTASAHEQVAHVAELLERASGAVRTRLLEVGSLFAEFCGWLADDSGDTNAGRSWSGRALEWAEASANANLRAYVLMRMSQQAQLVGQKSMVSGLAEAALRHDSGTVTSSVRAAAAQQAAHGYALGGNSKAALKSWDQANHFSQDGGDDSQDAYGLADYCTTAYLKAQQASMLSSLGLHEQALLAYTEALRTWPEEYRRERGLHLARQTATAFAANHMDHGFATAAEALNISRETGSWRTIDELWKAVAAVETCSDGHEMRELRAALEDARQAV